MRVTQAFLPLLREGERPGRIVNMSSQVKADGSERE
jgi:NAD(P)-dependent dehydrogenase (short-subunit alcohol dehydrogenase family)